MKKTFHAKVPYAIFHNHEVPKIVPDGRLSGFISAVLSEPQPSYSAIAKQVLATFFLKSRPPPMPIYWHCNQDSEPVAADSLWIIQIDTGIL